MIAGRRCEDKLSGGVRGLCVMGRTYPDQEVAGVNHGCCFSLGGVVHEVRLWWWTLGVINGM